MLFFSGSALKWVCFVAFILLFEPSDSWWFGHSTNTENSTKSLFVDLFIDWIGGYKQHFRMIFKTPGKVPFIKVQQVHPIIYKFSRLRNHSKAVLTTEISTPEQHTHTFSMPPTSKLTKALFSEQGGKTDTEDNGLRDTEAQLHWDCEAVTCHLERKI